MFNESGLTKNIFLCPVLSSLRHTVPICLVSVTSRRHLKQQNYSLEILCGTKCDLKIFKEKYFESSSAPAMEDFEDPQMCTFPKQSL